jgi:hypothetical protein
MKNQNTVGKAVGNRLGLVAGKKTNKVDSPSEKYFNRTQT